MKRWTGPLDAPSYRLLFLDHVTGWIEHYDEFEATSDEDAAAYARAHADGRRVELWRGHRRLLQLPAAPVMMLRQTMT